MSDAQGDGRRPSGQARRRAVVEAYTEEERQVARYARHAYVHHRSAYQSAASRVLVRWEVPKRYDGVTRASLDPQDAHKRVVNVWFEMARWFVARKIDPDSFIQFVFSRLDTRDRVPEPLQVCSDRYVPAFTEYVTKLEDAIVSGAYETQTRSAQAAFLACYQAFAAEDPARAVGKTWTIAQNVILDRALPLSPLFRYLLALSSAHDAGKAGADEDKCRFLALARSFYDRAVAQFWTHRDAYARHWQRWLPKSFVADATRRYRRIAFNEAGGADDDDVA